MQSPSAPAAVAASKHLQHSVSHETWPASWDSEFSHLDTDPQERSEHFRFHYPREYIPNVKCQA